MTSSENFEGGFSLVEVLLVLIIAAWGSALIGANLFKSYEKAQTASEIAKLQRIIDRVSWKTFLRQNSCVLTMHRLDMDVCGEHVRFERISFGEQPAEIRFDNNGFPNQADLAVFDSEHRPTIVTLLPSSGMITSRGGNPDH